VDKEGGLSDSDAEDRGAGTNLDDYIRNNFSVRDATKK
jgi:hypothetical protein